MALPKTPKPQNPKTPRIENTFTMGVDVADSLKSAREQVKLCMQRVKILSIAQLVLVGISVFLMLQEYANIHILIILANAGFMGF